MGTRGRDKISWCPCFGEQAGYQKIVDLKDAGLVIYRQIPQKDDENGEIDLTQSIRSNKDIFILHNTKDEDILTDDILLAFEQFKISCPRCRHIVENAQKLVKTIPKINRKDIMGICDRCRRKLFRRPCRECDDIARNFINGRDQIKEAKQQVRVWLSKIQHLLQDVVFGGKNRKRKTPPYSDIDIGNLHHNSPVSLREPQVTDLLCSNVVKTRSETVAFNRHSRPDYSRRTKMTTFAKPNVDDLCYSKSQQDLSYPYYDESIIKSPHPDFDARKSKSYLQSKKLLKLPVSDILLRKYYSDESLVTSGKPQHSSKEMLLLHKRIYLEEEHTAHGKCKTAKLRSNGKKTFEERLVSHERQERLKAYKRYASEERMKSYEGSSYSRDNLSQRKFKSEEILFKTESDIFEQGFRFSFPHKEEEKIESPEKLSSSELIKDTQDMLQQRAETERVRLKEEDEKKNKQKEKELDKKIRKDVGKNAFGAKPFVDDKEKIRSLNEQIIKYAETEGRENAEKGIKGQATDINNFGKEQNELTRKEQKETKADKKHKATSSEEKVAELLKIKKSSSDKSKAVPKMKEPSFEKSKIKEASLGKIKAQETLFNKHKIKNQQTEKPKATDPLPEKTKTNLELPEKHKIKEPTPEQSKMKEPPQKESLSEKSKAKVSKPEKPLKEPPHAIPIETKEPRPILPKQKEHYDIPNVKKPSPEMPKKELVPEKTKALPKEQLAKSESKKDKSDPIQAEKELTKESTKDLKEPVKEKDKSPEPKPKTETKADLALSNEFKKLVEEQAKSKEERQKIKKIKEEEEKKARELAEKKLKEMEQQAKSAVIKPTLKPEPEKPKKDKEERRDQEPPTIKELNITQIKMKKPSGDDLILKLVKLKQETQTQKPKTTKEIDVANLIMKHKRHKNVKDNECVVCTRSDVELELESIANQKEEVKIADIIIGPKIFKYKPPILPHTDSEKDDKTAIIFKSDFNHDSIVEETPAIVKDVPGEIEQKTHSLGTPVKGPGVKGKQSVEQEVPKGIVRYALSDRTFIDKGWTLLPTEKVVRKMNVYRMRPAQPEFDWFEHNKNKRLMTYDTGEKLAEFDDNGRGRWYYKNGRLALDYYDAEEINAQQRFVVYSNGEPDDRGRSRPFTILATFDYLGNGIVFDHSGKIRLKYNQTEGVVLDRAIGPVSHWKWHTLNDPPVLQQVMIDTQMPLKDPDIIKLGGPGDNKTRPDNEEMLAIEFDNFIKEKSKKLTQKFKPFQIKMKALKINECFSLKVLDQATVYLIFRDGSANLKLNIGMILDHKEIVDTDTAEVGEVSNNLERLPARTDSIAGLQRSVAHAQRVERLRVERERRLRPPEPCGSADRLTAAAAKPLRPPFCADPASATPTTTTYPCKCRKPSSSNLYYDTRLF